MIPWLLWAVQKTFYAAAAASKGWAGCRLELRICVGPYLAAAVPHGVGAASLFGGYGGVGGSSGFADQVLDVLSRRRRTANGPVLSGGSAHPVEVRSDRSDGAQPKGLDGGMRSAQFMLDAQPVRGNGVVSTIQCV